MERIYAHLARLKRQFDLANTWAKQLEQRVASGGNLDRIALRRLERRVATLKAAIAALETEI